MQQLTIYKKGQGFWTRMLTAVGAGILLLAGTLWLKSEIASLPLTISQDQTATLAGQAVPDGGASLDGLGIELALGSDNQTRATKLRSVKAGSPAAAAGLEAGDVVASVGGKAVANGNQLIEALEALPAGQDAELAIVRPKDLRNSVQIATVVIPILLGGALLFWVMNKPNIADFMIATEAEMRKVNWPSKRELILSTWVVIAGTFMLATVIWAINVLFTYLGQQAGILQVSL